MAIPRNVMNIEAPILKLTNFDVFHADMLFEILFGYGETESFNQIFEEVGFEGHNFVLLIGDIFIMLGVIVFMYLPLHFLFRYAARK